MLKQRIIKVMVSLAVVAAATGLSGIVFDSSGLGATSVAHACQNGGSQGGGC